MIHRKTNNPLFLILACLMAGLSPHGAIAQTVPSLHAPLSAEQVIALFDENKDGRISRVELRFLIIKVFDDIDRNRDNGIDPSEASGVSERSFRAADIDKDGKLSVAEYSDAEFLSFDAYDRNRDGFISAQEITAFRNRYK